MEKRLDKNLAIHLEEFESAIPYTFLIFKKLIEQPNFSLSILCLISKNDQILVLHHFVNHNYILHFVGCQTFCRI